MGKKLKTALLSALGGLALLCLALGTVLHLDFVAARAEEKASTVSYDTVAVHDPSIVVAYEGGGKSYPTYAEGREKVYYVFGTQASQAYSTDLKNWHSFTNELNNDAVRQNLFTDNNYAFSGHTTEAARLENLWAPDVIWNPEMQKWCMYLTVNGPTYNSSIVLLTSDYLRGAHWEFKGTIVYSGIYEAQHAGNDVTNALAEYTKVTGKTTVDDKYHLNLKSGNTNLYAYGVNAIDACVKYDENGDLWMSYGSWFGGIYMLKLDKNTGLRDYTEIYEDKIDGTLPANNANDATFTVNEDEYLGIHIAGGHGVSGEGSYILKVGEYYYLYMSYGGYAPDGGYNMRLFRSSSITGPYVDAANNKANFSAYKNNVEDTAGIRVMSGYKWSWWDFAYVAQGHNSAFTDSDGNSYLLYHNKYMDGTAFHVMKAHRIMVNKDGWLVTAPFEATEADELATGLTAQDIAGTYGVLNMTKNSGGYGNPCTEGKVIFTEDGNFSGAYSGSWTYTAATGAFRIRISGGFPHNGYLIYQNMEGTNLRTLAFTAVSTEGNNVSQYNVSQYTYWGYKYPSAEKAGELAENFAAIPSAANPNAFKSADLSVGFGTVMQSRPSLNGLTVTADVNGQTESKTIPLATEAASYSSVSAGGKFFPMNLSASQDISLTFTVKNVKDDWVTMFGGSGFQINLATLVYGTTDIFERSGTSTVAAPWDAFKGNSTVKIVLQANGGMQFYKNNSLVLTYAGTTKFNDNNTTIAQFTAAVREAIANGTFGCAYGMTNVTVTGGIPESLDLSATNGVTVYKTVKGNSSGASIDAIPDAETTGVAVSFKLNTPIAAGCDWTAVVIGNSAMNVTASCLNPWDNTVGFTQTNLFPFKAEPDGWNYLQNGAGADFMIGATGFFTVSVSPTDGIEFYKDGVLQLHYPVTANMSNGTTTLQSFVDKLLSLIKTSGFTFAEANITATDLIVSSAISDTQAVSILADYNDIAKQSTYRSAVNALAAASTRTEKIGKIQAAKTAYKAVTVKAGVADAKTLFDQEIAALEAGDAQAIADFKAAVQSVNSATDFTAKGTAITAAEAKYLQIYDKENAEVVTAYQSLTAIKTEYGAQAAFRTAVEAISSAQTNEAKLEAIRNALSKYEAVTEKEAVATEYEGLTQAIAAYNAHAEEVNGELQSATETALKALSSALAGIGAIALVWAILKKVL